MPDKSPEVLTVEVPQNVAERKITSRVARFSSTVQPQLSHFASQSLPVLLATMAGARAGYHQDYIARIRHSNALPAPPFPPKLLEIPNTGLASGQYTAGNYAARLAREQPLNVDVDVFGGMEINLVGLKGAFEGDDHGVYFEEHPPPVDPADRFLLRPLATIGKPTSINSGVSFLRRTEYISSQQSVNKQADTKNALRAPPPRAKPRPDVNKDNPINILRSIVKGFDVAYPADAYTGPDSTTTLRGTQATTAEKDSWAKPRHPVRKDLKLLDAYPILPDLDAIPEEGGYAFFKYQHNPSASDDTEDPSVDISILRPDQHDPRKYTLFFPENVDSVANIKRKFSMTDPSADDDDLYDFHDTDLERPCFRYKRIRTYHEEGHFALEGKEAFNDTIAVALHDSQGADDRLQTAAYMYPISIRGRLVATRPKTVSQYVTNPELQGEGDDPDFVLAMVENPPEGVQAKVDQYKALYDPLTSAEM